jgi:uncharacterized C2H2 Zn-finger protein
MEFCHFHRQPICRNDAAVCAACGVKGCSQCFTLCPECGKSYCRTHFDQSANACHSCLKKREKIKVEDIAACPRCGKALSRKGAKFYPGCGQKLQAA